MEDASSGLAILPVGDHPGREAAAQLGVPCVDVSLDGARLELTKNGRTLTASSDPVPPSPGDPALFLHTSGTTSRPKGVPLTHANLMSSLANISDTYALTPDDTSLIVMPLFHVHGLLGATLSTFYSGGTVVVPPRFSASSFWADQEASGATWYSAVPTIHQILLQRADDDGAPRGSFRFIRSCSSALAPAVFGQLEDRFDAPVLEAYGMTEAAHQMSSNPLPPGRREPGTVGAGTGVDIAIMDMDRPGELLGEDERGEVVIRGPNVMHGYRNNPDANADAFANGWFRTGDQGMLDTIRLSHADRPHQGVDQPGRREDITARGGRGSPTAPVGGRGGVLRRALTRSTVSAYRPRSCWTASATPTTSSTTAGTASPPSRSPTTSTSPTASRAPPPAKSNAAT